MTQTGTLRGSHYRKIDGTQAEGSVLIELLVDKPTIRDEDGNVIWAGDITVPLTGGAFVVELPAGDGLASPAIRPSVFSYRVTEQLKHLNKNKYRSVIVQVPTGGTLDLADVEGGVAATPVLTQPITQTQLQTSLDDFVIDNIGDHQAAAAASQAAAAASATSAAGSATAAEGFKNQASEIALGDADAAMAAAIENPASDTHSALSASIGERTFTVIEHGDNASEARLNGDGNTFAGRALWIGSVAPTYRIAGDYYWEAAATPVPVLVWSDSAGVDGALGTTEQGSLTWATAGSGFTGAKSGGEFVFTAAGAGIGSMTVTDALTDCSFRVTVAARGTQYPWAIFPRYVNLTDHVTLNAVSTSDATYRIVKRVANSQTVVATLTGFVMTDGDEVEVITKSDGTLIVKVNDVEAYNDILADHASATARGIGVRVGSNATTCAWANLSVHTLVD